MQGGVAILTPTQGVNISSYIQGVLRKVRQNWYASLPDEAYAGNKGVVAIKFQIRPDGNGRGSGSREQLRNRGARLRRPQLREDLKPILSAAE